MTRAAHIAFGANLGNPEETFRQVLGRLSSTRGIKEVRSSPLYRTAPAGGPEGQDKYVNGVIEVRADLSSLELFDVLRSLETDMGRTRETTWGPRLIDLDLVLMGDEVMVTSTLIVPHPRMHRRWFVLRPLADLDPDAQHPLLQCTVSQLLELAERRPRHWIDLDTARDAVIGMIEHGGTIVGVSLAEQQVGSHGVDNADRLNPPGWALVKEIPSLAPIAKGTRAALFPAIDLRHHGGAEYIASLEPGTRLNAN